MAKYYRNSLKFSLFEARCKRAIFSGALCRNVSKQTTKHLSRQNVYIQGVKKVSVKKILAYFYTFGSMEICKKKFVQKMTLTLKCKVKFFITTYSAHHEKHESQSKHG
jgi:hypothetical protein